MSLPYVTYAIIERRGGSEKWNLMGIIAPHIGHMACINARLDFVQMIWNQLTPDQKRGAKIVKLMEIEDVKTVDHQI